MSGATAVQSAPRRIDRGEKDAAVVRFDPALQRLVVEVAGQRIHALPGWVLGLPEEQVDELVRGLMDENERHWQNCFNAGKRQTGR